MKSVIIGAGTYGEVYLSYLLEAGVEVVGFLDDAPQFVNQVVRGVPVIGGFADLPSLRDKYGVEAVYCPLGNNKLRVRMLNEARSLGLQTPNFIHRSVFISPNVQIADDAVYILPNTLVMPHVTIEQDVMISAGSNIIHHAHLGQGTFVSNGVNFGANVHSKKFSYVGMGATVMTGVHELGEDCLIGAGAVVIKDVPDYAVVAGVPAKVLKYKTFESVNKSLIGGGKSLVLCKLYNSFGERRSYAA